MRDIKTWNGLKEKQKNWLDILKSNQRKELVQEAVKELEKLEKLENLPGVKNLTYDIVISKHIPPESGNIGTLFLSPQGGLVEIHDIIRFLGKNSFEEMVEKYQLTPDQVRAIRLSLEEKTKKEV
jgi:hypothetical protein